MEGGMFYLLLFLLMFFVYHYIKANSLHLQIREQEKLLSDKKKASEVVVPWTWAPTEAYNSVFFS